MPTFVVSLFLTFVFMRDSVALPDKPSLDKYVSDAFIEGFAGLHMEDLATGETYGYNDAKYFVPASTLKILTALMGFEVLGTDYQFTTTLFKKGQDLYLQFTGDPTLQHHQLVHLFGVVPQSSAPYCLHVIEDGMPFDSIPPGWAIEDTRFYYGAPVRSMTVNGNLYKTHLGLENGVIKTSDQSPPFGYMIQHSLQVIDTSDIIPDRRDTLHGTRLAGAISKSSLPLKLSFPLQDKRSFGQGLLKHVAAEAGVSIVSPLVFDMGIPNDAQQLQQIRSAPLSDIMVTMMHDSDNMMAEIVYVKSLMKMYPNLRNWDEANDLMVPFFKSAFGVDLKGAKLLDGSGLTRAQLITPLQMSALLKAALNKTYYPQFLKCLKMPRWSKTLDFVSSKTGTMGRINCLAGYFKDAQNHDIVFTVFINNDAEEAGRVHQKIGGLLQHAAGI